jgi:hypothetical protein
MADDRLILGNRDQEEERCTGTSRRSAIFSVYHREYTTRMIMLSSEKLKHEVHAQGSLDALNTYCNPVHHTYRRLIDEHHRQMPCS